MDPEAIPSGCYGAGKICPHSSMDRVKDCGSFDRGSNPLGGTSAAAKGKSQNVKVKITFYPFWF